MYDYTRNVIRHFGPDAAGILNIYSCMLEDTMLDAGVDYDILAACKRRHKHIVSVELPPPGNNIVPFRRDVVPF